MPAVPEQRKILQIDLTHVHRTEEHRFHLAADHVPDHVRAGGVDGPVPGEIPPRIDAEGVYDGVEQDGEVVRDGFVVRAEAFDDQGVAPRRGPKGGRVGIDQRNNPPVGEACRLEKEVRVMVAVANGQDDSFDHAGIASACR